VRTLTKEDVRVRLTKFSKEIFVDDVEADCNTICYVVRVNVPEWLMNEHFPGTSIIQCFYQGAQLLFYENDTDFDPSESLFFSGGIKVKFLNPIFEGHVVTFKLNCECFTRNVLLFEGVCVDPCDKTYAKASGSLSSKKRADVIAQRVQTGVN
jgi:hypothetical protein